MHAGYEGGDRGRGPRSGGHGIRNSSKRSLPLARHAGAVARRFRGGEEEGVQSSAGRESARGGARHGYRSEFDRGAAGAVLGDRQGARVQPDYRHAGPPPVGIVAFRLQGESRCGVSVYPGRKGGHDALALYADGAERNSGDRGGTRGDSGAGRGISAGGADPAGVRSGEDRRGDGESDECGAAGGGGGYGGPGFVDERRGAGKVPWVVRGLGSGGGPVRLRLE